MKESKDRGMGRFGEKKRKIYNNIIISKLEEKNIINACEEFGMSQVQNLALSFQGPHSAVTFTRLGYKLLK